MGSCAAPSAKGDDKFITTDYLQQCPIRGVTEAAMISKHSFVLSGNKNGKNKTGMAVSVTAMFISQYAGKNYS